MKRTMTLCAIVTMALFVSAATAGINTVASSTMWFKGTLSESGGAYTGTIAMVNEATEGIGDGIAGFDVFAKNGAWATYDKDSSPTVADYTEGQITTHDAYKEAGGWGATYDPDCGDWDNYQLKLTPSGGWFLEYNSNVGNDGTLTGAAATPMSGTVNWGALLATETGTGEYYSGMGTPQDPGYAATFAASKGQSTAGAWDMDWSWGSDYVPLEYANFAISVTPVGGDDFLVSLTPVPLPAGVLLGFLGFGAAGMKLRKYV